MTTHSQHIETQICKVLLIEYDTILKVKWISYEKLMLGIQIPLLSSYQGHSWNINK